MDARVVELPGGRGVIVSPFGAGRYILTSTRRAEHPDRGNGVCAVTSFMVVSSCGNYAVEWEPEYGPISFDAKSASGERFNPILGLCHNDWTQLGVAESGLPRFAETCSYEQIFKALEKHL
jgi:hypothetical protein